MKHNAGQEVLDEVLERLRRLEDELAVHRLLAEYALAVDRGDREALEELLTDDAVYELDSLEIVGREAISHAVFSGEHGAATPFAAHTVGPLVVQVDGDRATARGYSRLYLVQGDEFVLWRLSFNRWFCLRTEGRWRVTRRVTRLVGSAHAPDLLRP